MKDYWLLHLKARIPEYSIVGLILGWVLFLYLPDPLPSLVDNSKDNRTLWATLLGLEFGVVGIAFSIWMDIVSVFTKQKLLNKNWRIRIISQAFAGY